VALALVAAASLLATFVQWQANQSLQLAVQGAERRAEAERETAREATQFLADLLDASDEKASQEAADRASAILDGAGEE
jgi:hypothetical protein